MTGSVKVFVLFCIVFEIDIDIISCVQCGDETVKEIVS